MKGAIIAVGIGASLSLFDGWVGLCGWVLFGAAAVGLFIQHKFIRKLSGELTSERNARQLIANKVDEQRKRIDKQQQEIMRFTELEVEFERQLEQLAKEKAELIARIEALEKERITNRNHLVELAKSNEFLRKTLDDLIARVKTLEDK
jgi:uncharacterized protein (DUF3084 family)